MKIMITGVCGLIGSHLADDLLSRGHQVIGVDNLSFGSLDNIFNACRNNNFKFINTDIRETNFYKYDKNIDVVFHLAAYKKAPKDSINSSDVMLNNADMIQSVVNYVKTTSSVLIFTSTSDIYGNSECFLEDESITIGPPNIERYSYALSKLFDEQLLLNLVNENKIYQEYLGVLVRGLIVVGLGDTFHYSLIRLYIMKTSQFTEMENKQEV